MKCKLLKSLGVLSLAVTLVMSGVPVPVYATEINETKAEDAIADVEALESLIPEEAIYLSTEDDLLKLAENCMVDQWSVDKVVVLNKDIELTSTQFQGIPTFGGVFLGQGHTIKGINIEEEGSVMGFFRYVQKTAIVHDLHIAGSVHPQGSRCTVGGFAGENAGVIIDCSFEGTVTGLEQIGGIVGKNRTSGVLENCQVSGEVYGTHFIGGMAGENHGVVRNCTNHAQINTQSVQNTISIEDITVDSMVNTEVSTNATDIGGIAGSNSGVLRACENKGTVGYKNMGANIGGIAGNQKGYITECINYAEVFGRKEVGGIVGQMEPNMLLDYDTDSLQILSSQMDSIGDSMSNIESENSKGDADGSSDTLQSDADNLRDALEALREAGEARDNEKLNSYLEDLENYENWDDDRKTAAENDFAAALDDFNTDSENAFVSSGAVSQNTWNQMENITNQTGKMVNTVSTMDENLGFSVVDTSAEDTKDDKLGKVADCENYGQVKGETNVGGIAGIMAQESDLDSYQDTDISGNESLNATYEVRTVIRNCTNHAKLLASKQSAGGVAGQMMIGAVIESINLGNIDALNAKYVGGIAGESYGVVRDSSSRAIISGDSYVGGIAGLGSEVSGCYAFSDIQAYTEKGGEVVGYTQALPDSEDCKVSNNYYVTTSADIGGIDGISYVGVSDKLSIEDFLAREDIPEEFRTATVTFLVEGQNSVVLTVNIGESVTMDRVPELSTENAVEYGWEIVTAVTSEKLDMGETASAEYLSEDDLTNILFDQTFKAVFDAKDTVIKGKDVNENNLAVILAKGIFARDTKIDLITKMASDEKIDGKEPLVYWLVKLSNTGVNSLHYLIPEDVNPQKVKLFVRDNEDVWTEREFVQDLSYIIFDFADADTAFAIVPDYGAIALDVITIAGIVVVLGAVVAFVLKRRKMKKQNK